MKMSIDYLSKKLRTEHEITEKLSKHYDSDLIHRVIDRLKEMDLLNDTNYVSCYIRDRSKLNPMGRIRIRLELMQKGIPEDLIEKNEEFIGLDEFSLITAIIKKKGKNFSPGQTNDRRKLANFLYRRGFDPYNISSAIRLYDTDSD
jgi:regulatory protein